MSIGADPAYVKWNVVRGDTSTLRVEFYQRDESNPYDTTNWTYQSTVYDRKGNTLTTLQTSGSDGYVDITATAEVTQNWGSGIDDIVEQLDFDVEVTMDGGTVWTPVIGIISVIGDITGSGS